MRLPELPDLEKQLTDTSEHSRGYRECGKYFEHSAESSFFTDLVDFFLDGQFVEAGKGQAQEKADSAVENHESFAEGTFDLILRTLDRRGVRNAPVRRHGLTRPYRTHFLRGVVANRENKVQSWRVRSCEFIPVLTPQASRGQFR